MLFCFPQAYNAAGLRLLSAPGALSYPFLCSAAVHRGSLLQLIYILLTQSTTSTLSSGILRASAHTLLTWLT